MDSVYVHVAMGKTVELEAMPCLSFKVACSSQGKSLAPALIDSPVSKQLEYVGDCSH